MTGASVTAGPDAVWAAGMRSVVEALAAPAYAGRRVASAGGRAARSWLAAQLREIGAQVTEDLFPVGAGNLYARLPGASDLSTRDGEVLLTAHFDGVGDLPDRRRPGASDNASGVAVVLEAARLLATMPPAGVRVSVALLDGEEVGALGSARHAASLTAAGARPQILNVDGAGQLAGAVAVEAGGPAHGLLEALDRAGRSTGVPLRAGRVASDNRRYAAAGLAAVGIGAGMPGYHTERDTPERVEDATLVTMARLVVATVRELSVAGSTVAGQNDKG